MNKIIKFALNNRMFVLVGAVLIMIGGLYAAFHTEVDVFPDLNAPTVVVMTEAGGMATEEVEQLVTFPMETAINGATGVRRVRSQSTNGFSVVWVEFDWGTDIYIDRQIVSEKLASVREQIPEGVSTPTLGPQSSILGEVMIVSLTSDSTSLLDLRTMADWVIRPRLLSTAGVAQVSVHGGDIKEYQILLNAGKMRHFGVTLSEVMAATRGMNQNTNGGVLYEYGNEYIIRGITSTNDIDKLQSCLIKKTPAQGMQAESIITLADIADIQVGAQEPKLGVASEKGHPAVLLTVTKQPKTGTIELTEQLDSAISDLRASLPSDVHVSTDIFRQSNFINSSIDNVQKSLVEGAIFVVIVLMLFLGNIRTTVISLVTIPLAFLVTLIVLQLLEISINTMTLGGLAIAIGSLVDDAIVDVENVHKKLRQSRAEGVKLSLSDKLAVIYHASREVRMPILNSTLIIVVSFMPLFFLSGMEGRMLIPLGIAFITALFASTCVALTITPVLCSYLMGGRDGEMSQEVKLVVWLKRYYKKALMWVLDHSRAVVGCTAALMVAAVVTFCLLGTSFLPGFNEGSFTINISSLPGISLSESDEIGHRAERLLMEVPEIQTVARKTGRAELDEHALGVNVSEIEAPFVLDARDYHEVLADIRQKLSVLVGANIEIGQPISHRIDAMLSGTQANIAIKLFGTDLNRMFTIGNQIKEAVEDVEGIADLNVEQQIERPELKIIPRRELLARNGITLPEFNEFLAVNLAGETVSQVYEGGRSFNLVVKTLSPAFPLYGEGYLPDKKSIEFIRNLVIDTQDGRKVPLTDVADVISSAGPNTINRENVQRKIVISANCSGRDLGSVVEDVKEEIAEKVQLPEGYRIEYGGQFESQQSASRILGGTCVLAVVIIYLLLFMQFRNAKESAIILLNLPLALIGGVFALLVTTGEVSIPAIIGFISLFGIATRNGMLLITEYNRLRQEQGMDLHKAIIEGSLSRLNPILMTALTSALALVPLALGGDLPGNEIQSPMAKVILGGLISSTLLNSFIIPIVYRTLSAHSGTSPIMGRGLHNKSKHMRKLVILLMLALPHVLCAQSLDSVLNVVAENNLQLRALLSENEAEVLELKSENALSGPSVEYSPFYQKGYTGLAESELIVSEEFDFPTKYVLRNKQADLRKSSLESRYMSARRSVMLDARLLCLDIIRVNQVLEMLQRRLNDSEAMLTLFQKRLEAGDANLLEVNKVKIERMDVQKMVSTAESERLGLLRQLQTMNGGKAIDVTLNRFPEYVVEPDFESFLQHSLSQNADVQAAEADVKSVGNELTMARQGWLPSLKVGYRRNTEQKEQVNGFMVGVSFPLLSTANKVRAAKKRQVSSNLQLQQARTDAESELRTNYNQLITLQRVLSHDDVAMMNETLDLLNKALQHGEISALQYYTEIGSIYEKLLSHIDTHCESCKIYARLHKSMQL